VQGYKKDNKYILTVDYWNRTDGLEPPHGYLLYAECDTAIERLRKFEEAKIFDNKTIYEVENEITVLYG
jgi:hypothetical protein